MRVYVYSAIFTLFQQLLYVIQIMSADQYARTVSDRNTYFRNLRIAVCAGVRLIQQSHCLDTPFSCCKGKGCQ